jgi:hypothetical protein
MPPPSLQAPAAVAMVRPHHFHPNPETAADNTFQRPATADSVAAQAHAEVTEAAARLEAAGVRVHLFDSHDPETPDAVFRTTGSPPTRAAMWRSTPCTRPTAGASGAATSSRCSRHSTACRT